MVERIAVIDANARGRGHRYSTLDVIGAGPRHVAGFLRSLGLEVDLYSFEYVTRNPEILSDYDVLAVSAMITDEEAVRSVIKLWRRFSRGPVVLGGPITLDSRILKRLDFDLAIVGECEIPLRNLVNKFNSLSLAAMSIDKDREVLRGVATRSSLERVEIAPWAPREVLNSYEPDVEGIRRYDFWWACRIYVEIVRGCSNFYRPRFASGNRRCIDCGACRRGSLKQRLECPAGIPPGCGYCSVPLVHGPPRSRNVDSIVREVRKLLDLGATRIVLSAPDFLDYGRDLLVHPEPLTDPRDPPPNIDAIERLLKEVTSLPQVVEGCAAILIENVKPCLINEYVAELLGRYLRGTPVFIGVESASNELLDRVGRHSTIEECIKAIKLLRKAGLRPYIYLIHGLPSETLKDLEVTTKFVNELPSLGVEKVVLYRFTPLPRTAFEDFPKPPPAVKRRGARELYESVLRINREAKRELLGKTIRAVVACVHPRKRSYLVAYPLKHGPTILVKANSRLVGTIVEVVIERIISDRLVEGRIVSVIKRIARV